MITKTSFVAVFLISAFPIFAQTTDQPTPAVPVQAVITQNTNVGGVAFMAGQEVTLAKDPGKGFTAQILVGNRKLDISTNYVQVKASAPAQAATNGNNGNAQGTAADSPIVILKATYGVPGKPLQQVTSKLRSIITKGNASAANPIRLTVNESLAFYQTQTEATYHGTMTSTGRNQANFTATKDATPMLTVIYTVGGQQKMQTVAQGDTLVLP